MTFARKRVNPPQVARHPVPTPSRSRERQGLLDALKRSSIGDGTGVGLRAGTFESSFDDNGNQTITLVKCAFANDETVNGTVVRGTDLSLVADLTVSGADTEERVLHVEGTWQAQGPVGTIKISGAPGGRQVAVLVPEA